MQPIEIARRLAELGQTQKACDAYALVIRDSDETNPEQEMEAGLYILEHAGDYKVAYLCFLSLYKRGCFAEDCLGIINEAFYKPNVREIKTRYERNCKLLAKYPYLFRKDFPDFEDLPIRFYPFDEKVSFLFYPAEKRFGESVNFRRQAITRNFFKDLDKPVLADNVFSQYELEYLRDSVRRSEHVAMENHIYLHYPDWEVFCSYLQCLNMRPLLEKKKFVFLIGDEISQYPIDFKERFGIDYSQNPVKPVAIRDVTRMIWHTQLSAHNGGDFFNEVLDGHPNLLSITSLMFNATEDTVAEMREMLDKCRSVREAVRRLPEWNSRVVDELYLLRDRTDKDILVALFMNENRDSEILTAPSRIAPVLLFQPHFFKIEYSMHKNDQGQVMLYSEQYEEIRNSPLFRNFKYIKTFTPMRRPTTSYGATIKFTYNNALEESTEEKRLIIADVISQYVLNRSFMTHYQDRLYLDSTLVRFEDGKLNPKATFTALAAFLDIPYTESMTYCSFQGERDPESTKGNDLGFSTGAVYRTYDEFASDAERHFLEYFLRDAYEYYGYDYKYYDGEPMTEEKIRELVENFDKINYYFTVIWRRNIGKDIKVLKDGEAVEDGSQKGIIDVLLEGELSKINARRIHNAGFMMEHPHYYSKNGQPLHMIPKLELDPALLEQPLYR